MIELLCAHVADEGQSFADYPNAVEAVLAYIVRTGLEESITFKDFGKPNGTAEAPFVIIDPVNAENNVAAAYDCSQRDAIVREVHTTASMPCKRPSTRQPRVEQSSAGRHSSALSFAHEHHDDQHLSPAQTRNIFRPRSRPTFASYVASTKNPPSRRSKISPRAR